MLLFTVVVGHNNRANTNNTISRTMLTFESVLLRFELHDVINDVTDIVADMSVGYEII